MEFWDFFFLFFIFIPIFIAWVYTVVDETSRARSGSDSISRSSISSRMRLSSSDSGTTP